jgi:hypothetical protein
MHPLHDDVAKQISEHLSDRRCVVWYDERREFAPFIAELRGSAERRRRPAACSPSGSRSPRPPSRPSLPAAPGRFHQRFRLFFVSG